VRPDDPLGDELRRQRADPPVRLVESLVDRIAHERRKAPRHASLRFALAGALTALVLGGFAVFGGVSYASSVAHQAAKLVDITRSVTRDDGAQTGVPHDIASSPQKGESDDEDDDADEDQYKPGKGCGDKNHVHLREDECKSDHGQDD
jgi:hypothetical protein